MKKNFRSTLWGMGRNAWGKA